jgi:hypothetical protein
MGIGNETMLKAVQKASGRSKAQVRDELQKIGDLGALLQASKNSSKQMQSFFKVKVD